VWYAFFNIYAEMLRNIGLRNSVFEHYCSQALEDGNELLFEFVNTLPLLALLAVVLPTGHVVHGRVLE
jgi:hypothetical protein